MLLKHFLEKDQSKAKNEFDCMTNCLTMSTLFIETEEYDKAIVYMENVLRSLGELKRLNIKKKQHEKLVQLVKKLGKRNVKVMILDKKN